MKLRTALLFVLSPLAGAAEPSRTAVETYGPYVSQNEGFRLTPYHCTEGYYTVGVGHRLRTHEAIRPYTAAEVAEFFQRDLLVAVEDAHVLVPNFDEQPASVRRVLVDMAFQLGRPGLKKFSGFLHKVQYRRYQSAQQEIMFSKYYDQCPKRAERNIAQLSEQRRNDS